MGARLKARLAETQAQVKQLEQQVRESQEQVAELELKVKEQAKAQEQVQELEQRLKQSQAVRRRRVHARFAHLGPHSGGVQPDQSLWSCAP